MELLFPTHTASESFHSSFLLFSLIFHCFTAILFNHFLSQQFNQAKFTHKKSDYVSKWTPMYLFRSLKVYICTSAFSSQRLIHIVIVPGRNCLQRYSEKLLLIMKAEKSGLRCIQRTLKGVRKCLQKVRRKQLVTEIRKSKCKCGMETTAQCCEIAWVPQVQLCDRTICKHADKSIVKSSRDRRGGWRATARPHYLGHILLSGPIINSR